MTLSDRVHECCLSSDLGTWPGCLASLGDNISAATVERFNCSAHGGGREGNPPFVSDAICVSTAFFLGTLFNVMKPEVPDLVSHPGKCCLSELGGGGEGTRPQQHLDSPASSPRPGGSGSIWRGSVQTHTERKRGF